MSINFFESILAPAPNLRLNPLPLRRKRAAHTPLLGPARRRTSTEKPDLHRLTRTHFFLDLHLNVGIGSRVKVAGSSIGPQESTRAFVLPPRPF
jgi:hypothetical protein